MPTSHTLDYVVIALYLLLMLGVGAAFTRMTRNSGDYFKGGSRATWWLVGVSLYMGSFSAWTFTGAAGVAYLAGWSIVCIFLGNATGYLLNALWYARWFRQMRATTMPEVIRERFGPKTSQFYAWVGVVLQLPVASLTLYGLAIFCSSVFHLDVTLTIILAGLVVVGYSTAGGSWSVMATDFIQGLILIPVTLALAVLCLIKMGGIGGFFEAIHAAGLSHTYEVIKPSGLFPKDAYTWAWGAALFLRNMSNDIALSSAPRFFAVKDGRAATKAALLCMVLLLVGICSWFIPPITARLLFPAEVQALGAGLAKPAEASYVVAGLKLLPAGFAGIMVVAMFAATMSNMDTSLNRSSAIIVRDILPVLARRFRRNPLSDRGQLRAARWMTVGLGLSLIAFAVYFAGMKGRGVFELMITAGALLGTPMAVPMILAILFKRTPPWAAIAAVCAGFVLSVISVNSAALFGESWNIQTIIFSNFAASSAVFLATMPWWKRSPAEYRERVEQFFVQMKTPVDFEREVGKASDPAQLRLLGRLTIVSGLCFELLLFVPNPLSGRFVIIAVGAVLLIVGGLMNLSARRLDRLPPAHGTPESP